MKKKTRVLVISYTAALVAALAVGLIACRTDADRRQTAMDANYRHAYGEVLHAEGMLSLPYEAVLLAAAATAWLMISPIRMFALKFHGFGWTGNRLRYLFLGACVVLILTLGAYAIPAIFVLYVVVSLVRWLLQGRRATEA